MRIRWLWLAGHDSCWCYTICHPMSSGQCHSLTRTSLKMCNKVPWQIYARDVKGIFGQTHGVPRKDLLIATETLMVQPKFILWIFEAFIVSARSGLLKAQCFWLQDFLWIGRIHWNCLMFFQLAKQTARNANGLLILQGRGEHGASDRFLSSNFRNRHAAHQEIFAEQINMAITKQQLVQNLHKLKIYGAQMLPTLLKKFVCHFCQSPFNHHPRKKADNFPNSKCSRAIWLCICTYIHIYIWESCRNPWKVLYNRGPQAQPPYIYKYMAILVPRRTVRYT